MNLGSRIFALLLTIAPAIWGMCPCRILTCVEGSHANATGAASPCCPDDDPCPEDGPQDRHPSQPGPCKGCAFMETGIGVVPAAPVASPIPPVDAGFLVLASALGAHATPTTLVLANPAVRARGAAPPLERLASVVLLI